MSVWRHDAVACLKGHFWGVLECVYCGNSLAERGRCGFKVREDAAAWPTGRYPRIVESGVVPNASFSRIDVCPKCGWWRASRWSEFQGPLLPSHRYDIAVGALRNLSQLPNEVKLSDLRDYLTARYSKRHSVSPRLFEELVASVYRSLGYDTLVTGYTKDGGVDVVMHKNDLIIGVQVKRYKRTIGVEAIRAFEGALIVGDYTKGVFVTTSTFSESARSYSKEVGLKAVPIELVNASEFYAKMGIGQIARDRLLDQPLEFYWSRLGTWRHENTAMIAM